MGTLVTIALQINAGKLQEIPAPVPKSKKGNKGMYMCVAAFHYYTSFELILCLASPFFLRFYVPHSTH